MKFLYPEFLFALFSLAIPIVIHLFNFRKFKKVFFTNLRFLKEIQEETQSRQKLKHLLILLARCLAIAFLVFAFAQPFIPKNAGTIDTRERSVSVYADNSFSMSADSPEGELLESAKARVRQIASAYKDNDKFQLLTNDFEGKHQRLVNKTEFLRMLDEVEISPVFRPLSDVVSRQQQALNLERNNRKLSFILSDFQESFADFKNIKNDTSISVQLIPLRSASKGNISIDSVWFNTPVIREFTNTTVNIRLNNHGSEPVENGSLNLIVNGAQKGLSSFNISEMSSADLAVTFNPAEHGWKQAEFRITDHPLVFDDQFYFSFQVLDKISILNIHNGKENPYISSVYASDPLYSLTHAFRERLDYSSFAQYQLIILDEASDISSGLGQELKKYLAEGGNLLIIPSMDPPSSGTNDFMNSIRAGGFTMLTNIRQEAVKLNLESEVYQDVFEKIPRNIDLPKFNRFYDLNAPSSSGPIPLITLSNGKPGLLMLNSGAGKVYLSSVPFNEEWSDLPRHAVFPPFLARIPLIGGSARPIFHIIGKDKNIEIGKRVESKENILKLQKADLEMIPEVIIRDNKMNLFLNEPLEESGNFKLISQNSDNPEAYIAFNYNRSESSTDFIEDEELETIAGKFSNFNLLAEDLKNMERTIAEIDKGVPLWKLCIILTLLFFGIEILLLKFLK